MSTAPREIALLTNPTSGKGKGLRTLERVLPTLRKAGFSVHSLLGSDAEESLDLARAAVARGVETLVVVGGDGMVHLAAQALAGSQTRLGLIPAGTGNDVARYFAIPRRDPVAAVEVILRGRERTIDLAKVGSKHYVTVLAAGVDALVNERANEMSWPRGQMRYNLATVAQLPHMVPMSYVMDVDGVQHRFEAMLVAVGNGDSFGGGLRITEGASLDDGLLDAVVIGPMSRRELIATYPKLFRGTHVTHPKYTRLRGRRITIAGPSLTAYADGEPLAALPLTVEAVPQALRVVVP